MGCFQERHWPARIATALAGLAAVIGLGLASAEAQNTVKIGEIEAQTGPLNTYGWMSAQGMRMAVDEINKAGGFAVAGKTYTLELLNPDTQGNPQQALIELKKMLEEEQVRFVFGPFLTNIYKGIEPYATGFGGKFLLIGGATAIHFDLGKPQHGYLIRSLELGRGSRRLRLAHGGRTSRSAAPRKWRCSCRTTPSATSRATSTRRSSKRRASPSRRSGSSPAPPTSRACSPRSRPPSPTISSPATPTPCSTTSCARRPRSGLTRFWLVRGSLGPGLKNKEALDDYIIYIPKYFEEAEKSEPKVKKFIADYKAFYKTADFPYDQAPLCSSSCYDHVFMLVEAMQKAGTRRRRGEGEGGPALLHLRGLWNMRFDASGEEVFNFDVVDIKKGGKIEVTHFAPK